MNYLSSVLFCSCLFLGACGESTHSEDASSGFQKASYSQNSNTEKQSNNIKKMKLPDGPVSINWWGKGKRMPDSVKLTDPSTLISYENGKTIKYETMPIEKFLATHGNITFSKGDNIFPDWSLDINTNGLKPNSTIRLKNASAMLNVMENGEKLPKTTFMEDAEGLIRTGKLSALGMPIQVSFSTQEKNYNSKVKQAANYYVGGKAFATIGDIRVKGGKLDKSYDSMRTMILISKDYLKETLGDQVSVEKLSVKHSSYSKDKNEAGEYEGVEGLIVLKKSSDGELIRVHLLKKPQGWQAVEVLPSWKLLYSQPDNPKKARDLMKASVFKKTEALLKQKNITNHIDSSIYCNNTKKIGLCRSVITVLDNDEKTCTRKAYLFKKVNKQWKLQKEVKPDLKIDYKTHTLKKDKRKVKSMKNYVLNKAKGLMFGECSMF